MTRRGLPLRGDVLVRLRGKQKQDVAAKNLGVSLKTLGNWEKKGAEVGGRAEPANIAKLAEYYGVHQDELIVEGFAPPAPLMTDGQRLEAMERQLAALAAAVNALRVGAAAPPQPLPETSPQTGTKSKRSPRATG